MISNAEWNEWLQRLTNAELVKLGEERKVHRAPFLTETGTSELARFVAGSAIFSRIEPGDDERIGQHNMMVKILDDMGILDEVHVESIVRYMLTLPVLPVDVREEKK